LDYWNRRVSWWNSDLTETEPSPSFVHCHIFGKGLELNSEKHALIQEWNSQFLRPTQIWQEPESDTLKKEMEEYATLKAIYGFDSPAYEKSNKTNYSDTCNIDACFTSESITDHDFSDFTYPQQLFEGFTFAPLQQEQQHFEDFTLKLILWGEGETIKLILWGKVLKMLLFLL